MVKFFTINTRGYSSLKAAGIAFLHFFLVFGSVNAGTRLSPNAQISLLTITPGSDLFSAFGHSTLWVLDPANGIDKVYNYGMYDFNQPDFYLNFVKGHLRYTVSTYTFEEQYTSAVYEGRGITQQILALDSGQKQRIADYLEWNVLPENSFYQYDFYKDNCSTRLRDILSQNAGPHLKFDTSIATPLSYRQWMNLFLGNHPWSALGMNIGLGAPSDQRTDYNSQMYLPVNLQLAVSTALNSGIPLVKKEHVLAESVLSEELNSFASPVYVFLLLFLILLLLTRISDRLQWLLLAFDVSLIVFTGLLGLVLLLLWFATDHWVCAKNTDLLWANPLVLLYLLLFTPRKYSKIVQWMCLGIVIISFGYFTVAHIFPETPNFSLFPLILTLQLRVLYRLYHARTQQHLQ